jgi:CRISPR-associated exonuclease Cas4
MFDEEDLLPLSGLQHLLFCERQWALIHIEQQWEENRLTAEGRLLHERAHESGAETRPGVVTARGLRLRSLRLGLVGQADVVEFHRGQAEQPGAVPLARQNGWWMPFPVEYKRGRPKRDDSDKVQLCAQALCLEETYGVVIPAGALFYGTLRRRSPVAFDDALRRRTEALALRMREMYSNRITPPALYERKCENCSLKQRCMPALGGRPHSVARYFAAALRDAREDTAEPGREAGDS